MPTPLPQPFEVTPGPVLQAMRLGQADRLEQEQRGALKAAGQFAAKGDLGGARNYLYGQGMVDEGAKFDQMLRQTDADALAKAQRSHAVLGNLALAADTPEKWATAVDTASKAGLDVGKFRDFGARDMLLAQSNMIGQKIELEMKNRALNAKDEKPIQMAPGSTLFDPHSNKAVFTAPGKDEKPQFAQGGTDAMGNPIYGFASPSKQTFTPAKMMGTPEAAATVPTEGLKGPDFLNALRQSNPMAADKADNIIAGREAIPAASGRDKTALFVQNAVRQADPTYNANRFKYRQAWENSNTTVGKTRVANNTAIGHLFELEKMIPDAPDSEAGPLSNISTTTQKWYREASNDPWMRDYAANAQTLAGEIVKVNTGSEGSIHDRENIMQTLNPANGQKAIRATVAKYVKLLASKTDALAHDWKKNMGPYAEQPQVIDDQNLALLDEMKQRYGVKGGETPAAATPTPGATRLKYNPATGELE